MNRLSLLTIATVSTIAFGQTASAADLVRKAPVYDPPAYSWTGFYIGGNIGYSFGRSKNDASVSTVILNRLLYQANFDFVMDGVIGGGQIGYNWQTGIWVFGIETDIQGSKQKGNAIFTCATPICNPLADIPLTNLVAVTLQHRLDWFGTLRGRLGATINPTVMAFVTGGLAYGKVNTDSTLSGYTGAGLPTPVALASSSTTRTGWTIGFGAETRLSGNWTAKMEYLYIDFGSINTSVVNILSAPQTSANFNSHITDNIVRLGLNYRFN